MQKTKKRYCQPTFNYRVQFSKGFYRNISSQLTKCDYKDNEYFDMSQLTENKSEKICQNGIFTDLRERPSPPIANFYPKCHLGS